MMNTDLNIGDCRQTVIQLVQNMQRRLPKDIGPANTFVSPTAAERAFDESDQTLVGRLLLANQGQLAFFDEPVALDLQHAMSNLVLYHFFDSGDRCLQIFDDGTLYLLQRFQMTGSSWPEIFNRNAAIFLNIRPKTNVADDWAVQTIDDRSVSITADDLFNAAQHFADNPMAVGWQVVHFNLARLLRVDLLEQQLSPALMTLAFNLADGRTLYFGGSLKAKPMLRYYQKLLQRLSINLNQ